MGGTGKLEHGNKLCARARGLHVRFAGEFHDSTTQIACQQHSRVIVNSVHEEWKINLVSQNIRIHLQWEKESTKKDPTPRNRQRLKKLTASQHTYTHAAPRSQVTKERNLAQLFLQFYTWQIGLSPPPNHPEKIIKRQCIPTRPSNTLVEESLQRSNRQCLQSSSDFRTLLSERPYSMYRYVHGNVKCSGVRFQPQTVIPIDGHPHCLTTAKLQNWTIQRAVGH